MFVVNECMATPELMRIAADFGQNRIELSPPEKELLVSLLKTRATEELEYGQEIAWESVRVVRRVTGAVGVFFHQ